ncbi:hypothetical protein EIP91_009549 [Steccherinum ochraceum]|uniref:Enoyl reductase (ER) domain-containing protein n=1 Tax=Steccherinum ochraceum TaxID=92696 RepID=A0A4R0R3R6_9APHY|nr:hypothetical protein EIP91_009549 [Steccherinum ochraceum]
MPRHNKLKKFDGGVASTWEAEAISSGEEQLEEEFIQSPIAQQPTSLSKFIGTMPIVTNGRLIYVAHPSTLIEPGVHTQYVEEQIHTDTVPLDGGILLKTLALSSDLYMRKRMRDPSIKMAFPALTLGKVVDNFGVGVVLRSENPSFKPGDHVYGYLNFENYSVVHPAPGAETSKDLFQVFKKLDKHPDLPASIYVGSLGMNGQTAYSAWTAFAAEKAKTSKTLFVSSGAGPVGTFVIAYARSTAPHLKIVASAGSPEKLQLMREAGADVVFNYKTTDAAEVLAEHGPIDIYWDHVAGATLDAAIQNMNLFGLIIRVGTNSGNAAGIQNTAMFVYKCLCMQGIQVGLGDTMNKALEGFQEAATKLVLDGKLKNTETRYHGIKEAGNALADIHRIQTLGKTVIVVD